MTRVEQFEDIRRDRRLEGTSIGKLAKKYRVHRRVVRQALASAMPPPRKVSARRAPVMGPYEATIRAWLVADQDAPRKQRHYRPSVAGGTLSRPTGGYLKLPATRYVGQPNRPQADSPWLPLRLNAVASGLCDQLRLTSGTDKVTWTRLNSLETRFGYLDFVNLDNTLTL